MENENNISPIIDNFVQLGLDQSRKLARIQLLLNCSTRQIVKVEVNKGEG